MASLPCWTGPKLSQTEEGPHCFLISNFIWFSFPPINKYFVFSPSHLIRTGKRKEKKNENFITNRHVKQNKLPYWSCRKMCPILHVGLSLLPGVKGGQGTQVMCFNINTLEIYTISLKFHRERYLANSYSFFPYILV